MIYHHRRKSNYRAQKNRFKNNRESNRDNDKDRRDLPLCPLCKKQIKELISAINYQGTGDPAHFDCILREIEKSEELASHEKVCYLGNGSFGIVRFQKEPSIFPFIIRKRIQYEDPNTVALWREKYNKSS
jgi:hypothetical protein